MISRYLPSPMIPEDMEDMTFDEFFALIAQADYIRELGIADLQNGIVRAINAMLAE